MRYSYLLVFLLLSTLAARAQAPTTVSGRVVDGKDQSPLIGANVLLIHLPDSVKTGAAADPDGKFQLDNVAAGRYVLDISYVGYAQQRQTITVAGSPVVLGTLALATGGIQLKGVTVVGQAAQSVQKGDTTQYNARAFKTNPDANANDLIQKMPGVTVGSDGKVQAQGENVAQVLVDGKPFFGSDPDAVLKNLPADVIDKIEVFDQRSEQSRFSGFDDGNTTKTINIITKAEYKNGRFGRIVAGAGTERYKASGNINDFHGDRRISVVAQANNVNEQNFSPEDLAGVSGNSNQGGGGQGGGRNGGNRGGGGGGGGNASDFLVNQSGGITKSVAGGLNYSNSWNKKTELTGSYFFNRGDNSLLSSTFRRYTLPEQSNITYTQNATTGSVNTNHRLNFRLEHKIDSANTILFRPRFSSQQNDATSNFSGATDSAGVRQSDILSSYRAATTAISSNNDLLFSHRFRKPGRTFSLGAVANYNRRTGDNNLLTTNTGQAASDLNQFSTLTQEGWNLSGNFAYSEPLSKKDQLQINYTLGYAPNNSNKRTFNYENADQQYSRLDTTLSNVFENYYLNQAGGVTYRHVAPKYQASVGAAVQSSVLKSDTEFPTVGTGRYTFLNLLPNAMLNYKFSKQKNLRLNYRTSTSPPSVTQLQAVVNNSNPLQLTIGNPDLRQEYQHSVNARYTASAPDKASNFFALLGGSYTQNPIANRTTVAAQAQTIVPEGTTRAVDLPAGAQLTQPVNLSQQYTLRSLLSYGQPIKAIKTNVNGSVNANFNQTPGLVNGQLNYARTPSVGLGLTLSSNISEKLDFTVSSNSTKSYVFNTLQDASTTYFNQSTRLRLSWIVGPGISIQTDVAHTAYSGLSAGYNQQYVLWNASIGKKIFPGQRGEIKLYAFDLLNQNQGIQRNVTSAYYEDVQTTILQRYLMLMFTYNIRSGNVQASEAPADGPGGRGGRPDGPPPGGGMGPPPGGGGGGPYGG